MARNRTIRRMYDDSKANGAFVRCSDDCTCVNCRMQEAPEPKAKPVKVTVRRKCDNGDHNMVTHVTYPSYRVCSYGCGLYFRIK